MGRLARGRKILLGILLIAIGTARGATPPEIIQTDLEPLIRGAASSRTQFAVEIPFEASTANCGSWSVSHGRAVWHYAVRIPTAVSLSFHAPRVRFPASAILTVKGRSTTIAYRGSDLRGSELWGRIQPGDSLDLTITLSIGNFSSEPAATTAHACKTTGAQSLPPTRPPPRRPSGW